MTDETQTDETYTEHPDTVHLEDVQAVQLEITRATTEGRKPNFDEFPVNAVNAALQPSQEPQRVINIADSFYGYPGAPEAKPDVRGHQATAPEGTPFGEVVGSGSVPAHLSVAPVTNTAIQPEITPESQPEVTESTSTTSDSTTTAGGEPVINLDEN